MAQIEISEPVSRLDLEFGKDRDDNSKERKIDTRALLEQYSPNPISWLPGSGDSPCLKRPKDVATVSGGSCKFFIRDRGAMQNSISESKLNKAARSCRIQDSTDRLSYLPDSVLHHILSFLDTRSAVQTSVLSRQWRGAWKHVPVINIHYDSFEYIRNYESFEGFVDKVLSLRYPLSLTKVIFVGGVDFFEEREEALVARIIKYALSHGTQHLAIDQHSNWDCGNKKYPFSDMFGSIDDCSLKTLELRAFALDIGWISSGFQVLTKLELGHCKVLLNDEKDVVDPFSRLPCLKHLVLTLVLPGSGNRNKVLRISGLQLLSLDLAFIEFPRVGIYAPKLKSFTLDDVFGMLEFSELTIPSLDYADVGVRFLHYYTEDGDHYDYMTSLFNRLNNATSLMLRSSTVAELMVMSEFLENQPSPFTRLKSLTMEAGHAPFAVINYFLKGSSNMKPVKFK
ncbi:Putative F-box/LRR-repeat protein At3g28410 [Linum perenne]